MNWGGFWPGFSLVGVKQLSGSFGLQFADPGETGAVDEIALLVDAFEVTDVEGAVPELDDALVADVDCDDVDVDVAAGAGEGGDG